MSSKHLTLLPRLIFRSPFDWLVGYKIISYSSKSYISPTQNNLFLFFMIYQPPSPIFKFNEWIETAFFELYYEGAVFKSTIYFTNYSLHFRKSILNPLFPFCRQGRITNHSSRSFAFGFLSTPHSR